jgi:outer membrane protein
VKLILPRLMAVLLMFSALTAAHAEMKIAVVDFRQALMATDAAKIFRGKVQEAVQGTQDKAQALIEGLKKLDEKRKKDGAIMSDDEKKKLIASMQEKQTEVRFYEKEIQKTVQGMEQDFMKQHGPTAEKVTRELIKEKGYDMVLNPTAIVHALPEHDLTKELLDKLNAALK